MPLQGTETFEKTESSCKLMHAGTKTLLFLESLVDGFKDGGKSRIQYGFFSDCTWCFFINGANLL